MTLSNEINNLPAAVGEGSTGHLGNHSVIHEALKAHDADIQTAITSAETASTTVQNVETRVTSIEAMAGLSPESPVDGQTANLVSQSDTLTAAALAKKFAASEVVGQPDYVSLMASRSAYSKMSVTKVDNGVLNIRCASEDGEHEVVYTLTAPDRYRFIGLVRGASTVATPRSITVSELDLQGTYLGQDVTLYTTEVGDTWSVEITTLDSSNVSFLHFIDNRGGMWKISVDGRPELSTTVSTWAESPHFARANLFTIPTPGTYTIRGEFLGADPENPPSSGVARGWLYYMDTKILTASNAAQGTALVNLSPVSNKDFAFMMRPAGTESNFEFVPYHGTESEVVASPAKYYVAGSPLDVDALPDSEEVPIESFEVVQHIYGRNSSAPDPTQNIAEIWTSQKITSDGTYHVSGRWRPLVDVEMGNGSYPMMLPGYLEFFDEVISSVGTAHAVSGDNTPRNVWLTNERDSADGYAMLSSTSDFVAAVQVDGRRETLRVGAEDKATNMAWIELRAGGNIAKVYQSIFARGAVVPAGQMHRFSGRFWYGAAPGMRSVLSLS